MKKYWIDVADGIAVYDTDPSHRIFAHIFLFWKDPDILLVGGIEMPSHSELRRSGKALIPKILSIGGAGIIRNEKVVSWESPELGITTPEKFRQSIIEALGFK